MKSHVTDIFLTRDISSCKKRMTAPQYVGRRWPHHCLKQQSRDDLVSTFPLLLLAEGKTGSSTPLDLETVQQFGCFPESLQTFRNATAAVHRSLQQLITLRERTVHWERNLLVRKFIFIDFCPQGCRLCNIREEMCGIKRIRAPRPFICP